MQHKPRAPLKILLVTDVFPPGSGGSGWSTYYLGRALADRGHNVHVLRPRYSEQVRRPSVRRTDYGGLPIEELFVPSAPATAKSLGLARAWQERKVVGYLSHRIARFARLGEVDLVNGQHKVSALSAARGASMARSRGVRLASVATVRDYWPLCPVSTRLFQRPDGSTFECVECDRFRPYWKAVKAEGKKGTLPSLLAAARWVATWQAARTLRHCDAVVAVSKFVRDELATSGRLDGRRLYNIPNLVDLAAVDRTRSGPWPLGDISPQDAFALFAGKLDANKGADLLPLAVERAGIRMPVVVLGDGPLQEKLANEAHARSLDFRFYSWLDNDEVLRVMGAARVLLFPSAWQEPLSRVLLEGCACGAAIVALDTGGTGDIIEHGVSGWLAGNMSVFAEGIKRVATDKNLNGALRSGARARAERVFAAPKVAGEMEDLYYALLDERKSVKS